MDVLAAATAVPEEFLSVGVAVAVGLLLGLQRERTWAHQGKPGPAGARTFPIVALSGAVATLASREAAGTVATPWLPAAGLLCVGALVAIAYFRGSREGGAIGLTTEALLLLTYLLGCAAAAGYRVEAAITGVAALVLVGLKSALHGFAGRLTDEDEKATLKFLAVALLIVPFLPARDLGPYEAINPRDIGLMALLVSGVSFLGYVAVKSIGPERGLLATGLLGGLASTTATTASFARRSRTNPELSPALAAGTIASCFVLYPRVVVLAAVVNPAFAPGLLLSLAPMAAVGVAVAALAFVPRPGGERLDVVLKNPFELAPAFWFALLYGLVVLAVKAARTHWGDSGLYGAAAISGTTDVDAITLSAARLARGTATDVLGRVVVLAATVNTLVKVGLAVALGSKEFGRRVAWALIATAAAGGATVLFL